MKKYSRKQNKIMIEQNLKEYYEDKFTQEEIIAEYFEHYFWQEYEEEQRMIDLQDDSDYYDEVDLVDDYGFNNYEMYPWKEPLIVYNDCSARQCQRIL